MIAQSHIDLSSVFSIALFAIGIGACGPSDGSAGTGSGSGSADDPSVLADAGPGYADAGPGPDWDAWFADDPPPNFCGPVNVPPPEVPGGTPECPDDKNRQGCGCPVADEVAPCWPGLRVDRNRGICHDGLTTCEANDEFGGHWGECNGYVLPVAGATTGAEACNCFSAGRWEIDNLSPCFVTYGNGQIYAVSTFVDGNGTISCPSSISATPPPQPEPGEVWSTNQLTVDCSGQFELCYTLRAGDAESPQAGDCEVATVCTNFWYDEPGVAKELPPLPSWTSNNPTCAADFNANGGYGEMTVLGLSAECETIDDGNGQPLVFNRVPYCSLECNSNPSLPGCENCSPNGSGSF